MVAVYGKNFCTSARDSFFLVMRNALRAFVLDKVTDFLLFLGKLVVTGVVAIGSFYIFTHRFSDAINENVCSIYAQAKHIYANIIHNCIVFFPLILDS